MSGVFLSHRSAQAVHAVASRACSLPLAVAGMLRPSTFLRSVSRFGLDEADWGHSATNASAFPNPYSVIDALLGSPRLTPSFTVPGLAPVGRLPVGRMVELSNRGSTYVVDSGPVAGRPTFVLLHALACTGLLTWYPSLEMLRHFGRVVVFDQRWHGAGIASPRFLLEDCADDVAALAEDRKSVV